VFRRSAIACPSAPSPGAHDVAILMRRIVSRHPHRYPGARRLAIGYEDDVTKLAPVQLLRAFAALCVVIFHAQSDAAVVGARLGTGFARSDVFPWLAGVDIFFVISGFIMVHASGRWFGTARAPRVFLAHRIARIVPLYWATTMVYLAVVLLAPWLLNSEYLSPRFVIASFLFIPAARPDGLVQPLYSLGWTLNYEMFFYALFAIAIAFPRRRAVPALIAALILLVLFGNIYAPLPQPLAFWTDPIILEFAFGMALGWASVEGLFLNRPARLAFGLAGVALMALDPLELLALPRPLAFGLPAAFLVASAALASPQRRSAENVLIRWGVVLGDASYALYLLHPFIIRALRELVTRTALAALIGPWAFVMLCIFCAGGAALGVNRAFERPLTRATRHLLERPATRSSFEELAQGPKIGRGPCTSSAETTTRDLGAIRRNSNLG
jgi:exopolysaccharide production protein ExoZ